MTERYDSYGLVRLEENDCWAFLARHFIGRVGVVHMDSPMIFPVHYALEGQSVVFRTAPGTKLALAGAHRPAVFEVDEASELSETGTSVMVHGTLQEVTDREERARLAGLPIRRWAPGERDRLLRVDGRWVTGRRIPHHHTDEGMTADGG